MGCNLLVVVIEGGQTIDGGLELILGLALMLEGLLLLLVGRLLLLLEQAGQVLIRNLVIHLMTKVPAPHELVQLAKTSRLTEHGPDARIELILLLGELLLELILLHLQLLLEDQVAAALHRLALLLLLLQELLDLKVHGTRDLVLEEPLGRYEELLLAESTRLPARPCNGGGRVLVRNDIVALELILGELALTLE